MSIWIVKARKGNWRYLSGKRTGDGKGWGGEGWIRSNTSKKLIREEIERGDIVVCYQVDGGQILGLTRMDSDARPDVDCGLDFAPSALAFVLDSPLPLKKTGFDCFRRGKRQATLLRIFDKEFSVIQELIIHHAPKQKNELAKFLGRKVKGTL